MLRQCMTTIVITVGSWSARRSPPVSHHLGRQHGRSAQGSHAAVALAEGEGEAATRAHTTRI
eukprot:scaffold124121_cov29-Tisochrysis_lutea.AAC.1